MFTLLCTYLDRLLLFGKFQSGAEFDEEQRVIDPIPLELVVWE